MARVRTPVGEGWRRVDVEPSVALAIRRNRVNANARRRRELAALISSRPVSAGAAGNWLRRRFDSYRRTEGLATLRPYMTNTEFLRVAGEVWSITDNTWRLANVVALLHESGEEGSRAFMSEADFLYVAGVT